jgi:hypothetical protein
MRLDNAYPSAQDRADIEAYLATAKARRAALGEVRRVAQTVCEEVIAQQRVLYPQFGRHRSAGFEKGLRDMILLTQMAANAMFLGEHDSLDDQFTVWFRTILKAVHVSPQFMRDTFRFWHQSLEKHLSPEAYALLRPHAEHLSETLSDLPVPARDETGPRQMATAR